MADLDVLLSQAEAICTATDGFDYCRTCAKVEAEERLFDSKHREPTCLRCVFGSGLTFDVQVELAAFLLASARKLQRWEVQKGLDSVQVEALTQAAIQAHPVVDLDAVRKRKEAEA